MSVRRFIFAANDEGLKGLKSWVKVTPVFDSSVRTVLVAGAVDGLEVPELHPAIASAEATAIPVASFRFIDYYLRDAQACVVPSAVG
jgi:hypothetical protein